MKLTGKQKAHVRRLAQRESVSFQVGAKELHEKNIEAITEGFNTKEIIKIKVNRENVYDKEITGEIATQLEEAIEGSQVAGVIGTTIILFRRNKDENKRLEF